MANDKVDRLNSLMELVKLTSGGNRAGNARKTASLHARAGGAEKEVRQAVQAPHDIGELHSRLTRQLREIQADGRAVDVGQASRLIVREILIWEFGPQLGEHAEFGAMLSTIEQAFESNPSLRGKMSALLDDLRRDDG